MKKYFMITYLFFLQNIKLIDDTVDWLSLGSFFLTKLPVCMVYHWCMIIWYTIAWYTIGVWLHGVWLHGIWFLYDCLVYDWYTMTWYMIGPVLHLKLPCVFAFLFLCHDSTSIYETSLFSNTSLSCKSCPIQKYACFIFWNCHFTLVKMYQNWQFQLEDKV